MLAQERGRLDVKIIKRDNPIDDVGAGDVAHPFEQIVSLDLTRDAKNVVDGVARPVGTGQTGPGRPSVAPVTWDSRAPPCNDRHRDILFRPPGDIPGVTARSPHATVLFSAPHRRGRTGRARAAEQMIELVEIPFSHPNLSHGWVCD